MIAMSLTTGASADMRERGIVRHRVEFRARNLQRHRSAELAPDDAAQAAADRREVSFGSRLHDQTDPVAAHLGPARPTGSAVVDLPDAPAIPVSRHRMTAMKKSGRRDMPFGTSLVQCVCAQVVTDLSPLARVGPVLEQGSFTGAAGRHVGKFEQAEGGTIFLDEIGDMPLAMQAKLLRVLEEGEVERIGSDKPTSVDVRVVVATHRNLESLVKEGKFWQDPFHRIYVFPVVLPSLRDRKEDIPALVQHFAAQVCAQNNWKPVPFTPEAIEELKRSAGR